MTATVSQLVSILNRLAPSRLAESWDNIGLQIGNGNWPVKKIWTALDPLPEVVEKACENDVDLLVTHHPLFFKPVACIDAESTQGRIVEMALSRKLAIFSAHTNLDSVPGGVNDVLLKRLELKPVRVLTGSDKADMVKLVVFVPATYVKTILDVLYELDAGRISNYSCCTFRCDGIGTFLPDASASPAIGGAGRLTEVQESRVEILVARANLDTVVNAVRKAHPYESMAFDVYPLSVRDEKAGLGRVGVLELPLPLRGFAAKLKAVLNLPTVKVVGEVDMQVETVAVCSGSGASLLPAAIASGAQAYVSGDLGYHTARDAQQAGIGLIDVGHFASEHLVLDVLAELIRKAASASGLSVGVEAVELERDPFHYL